MKSDDPDITTMRSSLYPRAGWHYRTTPHPIAAMPRRTLVYSALMLTFPLTYFILLHTHIVRDLSAKFTAILEPWQVCRLEFARRADGAVRFTCEARGRPVASGLFDIDSAAP